MDYLQLNLMRPLLGAFVRIQIPTAPFVLAQNQGHTCLLELPANKYGQNTFFADCFWSSLQTEFIRKIKTGGYSKN